MKGSQPQTPSDVGVKNPTDVPRKTRQVTVILDRLARYIGIGFTRLEEEQTFTTRLLTVYFSQTHITVRNLNAHPASY